MGFKRIIKFSLSKEVKLETDDEVKPNLTKFKLGLNLPLIYVICN